MRLFATYRFGYAVAIVEIGFDYLCRYLQGLPVAARTDFGRMWSTAASSSTAHRHKEVEFLSGSCYFLKS
jgi:hypothetical protein